MGVVNTNLPANPYGSTSQAKNDTKEPGLKADYARKMEHPVLNILRKFYVIDLPEILKKLTLSSTENI